MKKMVIFDFPDDFEFPEYYGQENIVGTEWYASIFATSSCVDCPFGVGDESLHCLLTGDHAYMAEEKRHKCPFFGGADVAQCD